MSPSSQRAWIEIVLHEQCDPDLVVALLAEGVDRNNNYLGTEGVELIVALLAEGVDRNYEALQIGNRADQSPSSQRAWIEIG